MRFLNTRQSISENAFELINIFIMLIICFLTLYPIWYCIVNSFNDGADAMMGGIYWWPRMFSIDNYKAVFADTSILKAFAVTILRTVIGTALAVYFTAMVSYALSKKELAGRKIYMMIGSITLFFSGGLIPFFILIKKIGLYDNFLVFIIPSMFYFFNAIIFIAFFKELPSALEESAKIDGANDVVIFIKIIIPLSTPVLATIAIYVGVYHWNDYFAGVIFIKSMDLQPIQTFLYKIIAENTSGQMMGRAAGSINQGAVTSQSIKLATMVATTFPIVCVYPFLQKYFVKGILLGSVKG
ncbi:carbohydrate ABC transporter membrane protein 2 (CUT1 family) [Anaerobacterium chartisolvens]|uniref:Carbohydrate ABC transporter membrane protein 2 (CUT1 family) n=1 Tax=Anaerobacterium chartisolvens TaxID=1297424 RepID=A0A369AJN9_9FIRM|nr:carbohydrate ABC transporter permease [Anaerobacterium chartisolvens]RCX08496.1 carbohydrate ABC transporter membrane protein 2 (CUT1 family) [Anaerobacterium chartisolvens]